jgi:Ca2+-binding RTX toxin-like protein
MVHIFSRAALAAGAITGTPGDDDILVTAPAPIDMLGGFDVVRFDFLTSPVGIQLDLSQVWSGGVGRLNGYEIRGMEALGSALGAPAGEGYALLIGSSHDDVIVLGAGYTDAASIYGDNGNDLIIGGGGGSDDPVLGHNALNGGGGDDIVIGNGHGDDVVGEDGDDQLFGNGGDDLLFGYSGRDSLHGGEGNDYLRGGTDPDRLSGDGGDDRIDASYGDDRVDGGAGSDTVEYYDAPAAVAVDLQAGLGRESDGSLDHLVSIENAGGSFYDDVLRGSNAANRLLGDAGDDQLFGRGGDDILSGGTGTDRLEGGSGADTFVFAELDAGRDVIVDFNAAAGDRIDLSGIDSDSASWWADDPFTFVGGAAFSGNAGELRVAAADGGWEVSGDVDGDGLADFSILVGSAVAPAMQDFVL